MSRFLCWNYLLVNSFDLLLVWVFDYLQTLKNLPMKKYVQKLNWIYRSQYSYFLTSTKSINDILFINIDSFRDLVWHSNSSSHNVSKIWLLQLFYMIPKNLMKTRAWKKISSYFIAHIFEFLPEILDAAAAFQIDVSFLSAAS